LDPTRAAYSVPQTPIQGGIKREKELGKKRKEKREGIK